MKTLRMIFSICIVFLFTVITCACSHQENIEIPSENPFDVQAVDQSNSEVGFYGFGIDEISELSSLYNNLKIKTENGEVAQDIGLMVFVDGIPQMIDDSYCKTVLLKEKSEAVHEVTFEPVLIDDKIAGETASVLVASILRPSFKPSKNNGYVFGNCITLRDLMPMDITVEGDIFSANLQGLYCDETMPIDESFILKELKTILPTENSDGKIRIYKENDTDSAVMNIDSDGRARFSLYGIANKDNTYRVTVFVNNSPVQFNGTYSYADMVMRSDNMTKLDIELSSDVVNQGDIIYAIAVPIQYEAYSLIKTENKILMEKDDAVITVEPKEHMSEKESEKEQQFAEQPVTEEPVQQIQNTNSSILLDSRIMLLGYLDGNAIAAQSNEIIAFDSNGDIKHRAALPQNSAVISAEILNSKLAVKITDEVSTSAASASTDGFQQLEEFHSEYKLLIYDSQLNMINEVELNFINDFSLLSVSPDGKKLAYTKEVANILYVADINGDNEQILSTLNVKKGEPVLFLNIAFTDFGVVYSATGTEKLSQFDNDKYYGTIDFNGSNSCLRDDAVGSYLQKFNGGVFLPDRNVPYGQESSGILRIIKGNSFSTLSTQIKNQSQGAVISQDGKKVVTRIIDEKNNSVEFVVYDVSSGNIICTHTENYIDNIVWMVADGNQLLVSYNQPDNTMRTVSYVI